MVTVHNCGFSGTPAVDQARNIGSQASASVASLVDDASSATGQLYDSRAAASASWAVT